MKKVFVLNGGAGVGKDTFCQFLSEHISVYHYSSVTEVKKIARKCGWNGIKTEEDRRFLSDLKNLLTEYSDKPFNDMCEIYENFKQDKIPASVLIFDIREPDEIEKAVKKFKAKTILVENKNVKPITSNMADAGVNNYIYDYIIENNGTLAEFADSVKFWFDTFIEGKMS